MSETTSTIDWISGTFMLPEQATRFITFLEPAMKFKDCKPRFGYEYGCEYLSGMVVYGSTKHAEMGIHVIMSGSTLAYYIKSGIAVLAILENFVANRGKCTRLDLAIDLLNEDIDVQTIYKAFIQGDKTGIATKFSYIQSDGGGSTLYIGSRQSDRFARLYNKGAEQNMDVVWWRFEVECKGDVAKEYARVLAHDHKLAMGSFIWSTICKLAATERGNYMAFGRGSARVDLPKIEKTSDTKKWIIEQVIPALTNYLKETGDKQVIAEIAELLYNVENNHTWAREVDNN